MECSIGEIPILQYKSCGCLQTINRGYVMIGRITEHSPGLNSFCICTCSGGVHTGSEGGVVGRHRGRRDAHL